MSEKPAEEQLAEAAKLLTKVSPITAGSFCHPKWWSWFYGGESKLINTTRPRYQKYQDKFFTNPNCYKWMNGLDTMLGITRQQVLNHMKPLLDDDEDEATNKPKKTGQRVGAAKPEKKKRKPNASIEDERYDLKITNLGHGSSCIKVGYSLNGRRGGCNLLDLLHNRLPGKDRVAVLKGALEQWKLFGGDGCDYAGGDDERDERDDLYHQAVNKIDTYAPNEHLNRISPSNRVRIRAPRIAEGGLLSHRVPANTNTTKNKKRAPKNTKTKTSDFDDFDFRVVQDPNEEEESSSSSFEDEDVADVADVHTEKEEDDIVWFRDVPLQGREHRVNLWDNTKGQLIPSAPAGGTNKGVYPVIRISDAFFRVTSHNADFSRFGVQGSDNITFTAIKLSFTCNNTSVEADFRSQLPRHLRQDEEAGFYDSPADKLITTYQLLYCAGDGKAQPDIVSEGWNSKAQPIRPIRPIRPTTKWDLALPKTSELGPQFEAVGNESIPNCSLPDRYPRLEFVELGGIYSSTPVMDYGYIRPNRDGRLHRGPLSACFTYLHEEIERRDTGHPSLALRDGQFYMPFFVCNTMKVSGVYPTFSSHRGRGSTELKFPGWKPLTPFLDDYNTSHYDEVTETGAYEGLHLRCSADFCLCTTAVDPRADYNHELRFGGVFVCTGKGVESETKGGIRNSDPLDFGFDVHDNRVTTVVSLLRDNILKQFRGHVCFYPVDLNIGVAASSNVAPKTDVFIGCAIPVWASTFTKLQRGACETFMESLEALVTCGHLANRTLLPRVLMFVNCGDQPSNDDTPKLTGEYENQVQLRKIGLEVAHNNRTKHRIFVFVGESQEERWREMEPLTKGRAMTGAWVSYISNLEGAHNPLTPQIKDLWNPYKDLVGPRVVSTRVVRLYDRCERGNITDHRPRTWYHAACFFSQFNVSPEHYGNLNTNNRGRKCPVDGKYFSYVPLDINGKFAEDLKEEGTLLTKVVAGEYPFDNRRMMGQELMGKSKLAFFIRCGRLPKGATPGMSMSLKEVWSYLTPQSYGDGIIRLKITEGDIDGESSRRSRRQPSTSAQEPKNKKVPDAYSAWTQKNC